MACSPAIWRRAAVNSIWWWSAWTRRNRPADTGVPGAAGALSVVLIAVEDPLGHLGEITLQILVLGHAFLCLADAVEHRRVVASTDHAAEGVEAVVGQAAAEQQRQLARLGDLAVAAFAGEVARTQIVAFGHHLHDAVE